MTRAVDNNNDNATTTLPVSSAPSSDPSHTNNSDHLNNSSNNDGKAQWKIDPITALQDGIDGLSLAMFEALRGLRDAVAPESGNLGSNNLNNNNNNNDSGSNNNNNNAASDDQSGPNGQGQQQHPDLEDLWQLYRQRDEGAVSLIHNAIVEFKIPRFPNGSTMPQTRDQLASIYSKMEQSRDTELVLKLAKTVLDKSRWIDNQVDCHIPGMHRTMAMQQKRIQKLLEENAAIAQELQTTYETALQKRNACRLFVQKNTCRALDIEENVIPSATSHSASASAAVAAAANTSTNEDPTTNRNVSAAKSDPNTSNSAQSYSTEPRNDDPMDLT